MFSVPSFCRRSAWITVIYLLSTLPSQRIFAGIINAASVTYADVTAAVSSAADGDIVVIPAGTAEWVSNLPIKKAVSLQGAGADQTIILDSIVGASASSQAV